MSKATPVRSGRCRERELHPGDLAAEPASGTAGLPAHLWERALLGPVREFVCRPAKGLRRELVEIGWQLGGGGNGLPEELPVLVELIHAGSLIIDDIEDGSAWRRGRPALHRLHGTATALNAGGWLYFRSLSEIERLPLPPERRLALYERSCRALLRCHEGQALDVSLPVFLLERDQVAPVAHALADRKSGTLAELAASAGGLAAGADEQRIAALASFGRGFGIALQMLDDLGGLLRADLEHKVDEDLRNARATFAWAWLAELAAESVFSAARDQAQRVVTGCDPRPLRELLRDHAAELGRRRVNETLEHLHDGLQQALDGPLPAGVRRLLRRLERAYG